MPTFGTGTGRNLPHYRDVVRLLDPLAVRFQADHLLREPLEHLDAEGFELERLERYKLGIAARKPSATAA